VRNGAIRDSPGGTTAGIGVSREKSFAAPDRRFRARSRPQGAGGVMSCPVENR